MSDRNDLIKLLDRFGVAWDEQIEGEEYPSGEAKAAGETGVVIHAKEGNNLGYTGFVTIFTFNADGSFKDVGVWE